METIYMSDTKNAEMIHEEDAIETARKLRAYFKKRREEGKIK